jgi:hypothetical protein
MFKNLRFPMIANSRAYSNGGKARLQLPICAFTPSDFPEGGSGQIYR